MVTTARTIRGRSGPTEAWTRLRYHPCQYAAWYCPRRFVAIPAGRGSGKTELLKRRLVRCLLSKPYGRFFYGGPTYGQVKRVAWPDFLRLIPAKMVVPGGISTSELKIKTRIGSELFLFGLDVPQRMEGLQYDGGGLDESCDLKPGLFDKTVMPALTHRNGWCWRIGVPKRQGPSAPEFRKFFYKGINGDDPDIASFTWPSSDILPPEALRVARDNLDPKDYREQFDACWETAGGGIFYAFDREYNIRPCQYDPARALVVGCDFNVDPMAWVIGHRYPNRLEWFDEIWKRDTNTMEVLAILVERYASHKGGLEIYGDASSQSRHTSTASSDYKQILNDQRLKALGRTVHFPASNPPVADRFASCNAMFCTASGQRRMFVDPNCQHLVDDLEARYYKPGTREAADSGDLGHITDAMGYTVHKLFPIRLDLGGEPSTVIIRRH